MAFSSLWKWWRGRSLPGLEHLHVLVFTRSGCHLCESAWEILAAGQEKYRFRLEAVDVDREPELVQRYGELVPVVVVDGKVRFWGNINRVLLERFLAAEARRTRRGPTESPPGP